MTLVLGVAFGYEVTGNRGQATALSGDEKDFVRMMLPSVTGMGRRS